MGEAGSEIEVGRVYIDPNELDLDYQILMSVNGGGGLYLKNVIAKTGCAVDEVVAHFDCLADSGAFTFQPGATRIVCLSEIGSAKLEAYYEDYKPPEELPE